MIAEGLELSALGQTLYFALVAAWSGVAAYVAIFANEPGGHHASSHSTTTEHGLHVPAHASAPVEATRAKPFRGFSPYEGFKSYAQGEVVTIDDIVRGLARESGAKDLHEDRIIRAEPPQVSDPRRMASTAQANAFLELLVAGDRDEAFQMLRDLERDGEGAEPFLRRVLTAVESALEARIGGGTCDLRVMEILGSCETPALERLVAALATADKGKQSGKLTLTRALAALKSAS